MSEQKLFNITADACFYADDMTHAYKKLGKYFLAIGNNKPKVEFTEVFTQGEVEIKLMIEKVAGHGLLE